MKAYLITSTSEDGKATVQERLEAIGPRAAMMDHLRAQLEMPQAAQEDVIFAFCDEQAAEALVARPDAEIDVEDLVRPEDLAATTEVGANADVASLGDLIESIGGYSVIENRWRQGEGRVGLIVKARIIDA